MGADIVKYIGNMDTTDDCGRLGITLIGAEAGAYILLKGSTVSLEYLAPSDSVVGE